MSNLAFSKLQANQKLLAAAKARGIVPLAQARRVIQAKADHQWLVDQRRVDRQAALAMRKVLQERFPKCFAGFGQSKHPLLVGIHAAVQAAAPDLDRWNVRLAISDYCRSESYLRAVTTGATRIDLTGDAAGTVTDHQANFAAAKLKKFLDWKARKRQRGRP